MAIGSEIGRPLAQLSDEQLKELEKAAHQNWCETRRLWWAKGPLAIIALAGAGATLFDVLDHGLHGRELLTLAVSCALAIWPWHSNRMERHWLNQYMSALDERRHRGR